MKIPVDLKALEKLDRDLHALVQAARNFLTCRIGITEDALEEALVPFKKFERKRPPARRKPSP